MGLIASVFRPLRDPRVRFPHISAQSFWAFSKIKERKPNTEGNLTHAAAQPLGQVWDYYPPFAPLLPTKNSSRARAPPPPQREEQKSGPEPHWSQDLALKRSLTHQNTHLLLAEEAGEKGGDGEAHGGSGTCDGQEQKGLGASRAFSFHAPGKLSEKKEELGK